MTETPKSSSARTADIELKDLHTGLLAASEHELKRGTLTARELDILRRIAAGATDKIVAHQLDLSETTVKVHVRSIIRKLGFSNRVGAVVWELGRGASKAAKGEAIIPPLDDIASKFAMSPQQIADTVGTMPEALRGPKAGADQAPQERLFEMLEIIRRVTPWAGGERQAMAWYRGEPLPAFGDRTAESLVKDGKAVSVRDYLDHVATGGFA